MAKLFLDTNIIIDIILKRSNYKSSYELIKKFYPHLYISPITVTNTHYIAKIKSLPHYAAFLHLFKIVPLNQKIIGIALSMNTNDFEDAIQAVSAKQIDALLVTRNIKDFKSFNIETKTPEEVLEINR